MSPKRSTCSASGPSSDSGDAISIRKCPSCMKLDRTPRPSSTPSCTGNRQPELLEDRAGGVDVGHGHRGVPEPLDAERMFGPATGAHVPVVLEARVVRDVGAVRAVGVARDLREESTDRSRRRVEVVDVGRNLFHAPAAGQSDVDVVVEQVRARSPRCRRPCSRPSGNGSRSAGRTGRRGSGRPGAASAPSARCTGHSR